MNDRELLEMAAKAAGIDLYATWGEFGHFEGYRIGSLTGDAWNSLTDDGDALRLLNKLWLELRHVHGSAHAGRPGEFWCTEPYFPDGDINAATRRATTCAAAEIGKAMP